MNGIDGTEAEYRELINSGWTISYAIAEFHEGELIAMAQCYVLLAKVQEKGSSAAVGIDVPKSWPKDHIGRWSPSPIAKANLAKAGSLLSLEWDRLHATRP